MSNYNKREAETGSGLDDVDPIMVDADAVTVEKKPTSHDSDAVKIYFTITSTADAPVRVTIVDHHPDEDGPEEVAFHPEYDPENWTESENGDVSYETVVQPGDQRITVYGFRPSASRNSSWVLEPPTVETTPVAPPNTDERTTVLEGEDVDPQTESERGKHPREMGDTARDTAALGNGPASDPPIVEDDDQPWDRPEESVSALDDDPFATSSEPPASDGESADAFVRGSVNDSPLDREPATGNAGERGHTGDPLTPDGDGAGDGNRLPHGVDWYPDVTSPEQRDHVAELLLAEIEAGALDENDLDALRFHLDGDGPSRSVELKLDDLRRTVDELELYRDALEAFIDKNGDAKDIIDEVWLELDAAEQERARLADTVEEVPVLVDKVDVLEEELESYHGQVETVQSAIRSLKDSHERDNDRIDDQFEKLQQDLEETKQSLEAEFAAIHADIQQGKQWREQLSEAIQLAPETGDDESNNRSREK